MFKKITTARADVNSVLEEISEAARSAKEAIKDLNWMHSIEIKVGENGNVRLAGDPELVIEHAITGLSDAKARLELAVKKLDELQK